MLDRGKNLETHRKHDDSDLAIVEANTANLDHTKSRRGLPCFRMQRGRGERGAERNRGSRQESVDSFNQIQPSIPSRIHSYSAP